MEVVAVSQSVPKEYELRGMKISTSIIRDPITSSNGYIELNESGVVGNRTAAHDGPVYVFFAENYDYWCSNLGVERSAWNWCHWGENITLKCKDEVHLEDDIHLGDVWRIGDSVQLEVCGSRIPCGKLAWRCGQSDLWLKPLADSGRVGVYLRVLQGGRIHPGDQAFLQSPSNDDMDVATITRVAYDTSLTTRDTLDILANHQLLLRMNRFFIMLKLWAIEDSLNKGKHAWKGWRDLEVTRVVKEGVGLKSFYFRPRDEQALANYLPGQFLSIQLPGNKTRNWTISDFPSRDSPSNYRVTIKDAGDASSWMHEHCIVGTILPVRSPAGRFFLDWGTQVAFRQVYISAGIGITPILAMMKAHSIHPKFARAQALWIHVTQNSGTLPFRDELAKLKLPLQRHLFFTHPLEADIDGDDYDYAGRPDPSWFEDILGASYTMNPLGASDMTLPTQMSSFHICGPTAFETSIRECLGKVGVPSRVIKSESFLPSGSITSDLNTARVKFAKSNVSAIWNQNSPKSLLELAESLGLTPDYGCRVGVCGSCAAKLMCGSVTGGVQMDGTVLTCSAMPASESVELEL
ncbi:pyruvate kinase-like protein [Truncatella angustata]|uniref:Pyruvate kinase-like protein n=1 Tax=Truncatella angustata TaxID=152316 RepID=A0A9P8UB97_9PEZI|nr:pyruvate kinase-like protein [Truncatella angustata]KAH6640070.1 pyruvate kinase-like protein [Truncatella angustata]KAH8193834.1 hypothetical protein TruAng_011997 [Truncatella angustata]